MVLACLHLPVMPLREVAVDPVDDVQAAIRADAENIEEGEGFTLFRSLEHEELGKDCNRLEIY